MAAMAALSWQDLSTSSVSSLGRVKECRARHDECVKHLRTLAEQDQQHNVAHDGLQEENAKLRACNEELTQQVDCLAARVRRLEADRSHRAQETTNGNRSSRPFITKAWPTRKDQQVRRPDTSVNSPAEPNPNIKEFQNLLSVAKACANTTSAALAMLASAPCNLVDNLAVFFPEGAAHPLVAELMSQFNRCIAQATVGEHYLHKAEEHLQRQLEDVDRMHQALTAQDVAWDTKVHYDMKMIKLVSQPLGTCHGGGPLVSENKVNRNKAKQDSAQKAYDIAAALATDESSRMASCRGNNTAAAVAALCLCHAAVFGSNGEMQTLARRLGAAASGLALVETRSKSKDSVSKTLAAGAVGGAMPASTDGEADSTLSPRDDDFASSSDLSGTEGFGSAAF